MTEPSASDNANTAGSVTTSIANRLLRIIFGSYFAFTLLVTLVQLAAEYQYTAGRVSSELSAMRRTFGPGIANAMWQFQDDVLRGILSGMGELPVVVGVKVLDEKGQVVRAVGTVIDANGERRRGDGSATLLPATAQDRFWGHTFGQEFPVVYVDERGQQRTIGTWAVYSDRRVVIQQLEYGVFLICASAIIKATALWFIFMFVVRRWLGKPLSQLSGFVRELDIENLGQRAFVLQGKARDELHFLADAINDMARKLRGSVEQNSRLFRELKREQDALKQLNETLEQRVAERTAELRDANLKLEALSLTDGLTGIGNRRHLDAVLASEWSRAQRLGVPLTIGLLDVDWFKAFNDAHGHLAGDDCLRMIAEVLVSKVRRSGDLVARYGGEEFAFVAPGLDQAAALALAESLREAVASQLWSHDRSPLGHVTVSMGVASVVPGAGLSLAAVLQRIDQTLYEAKAQGRNRVRLVEFGSPAPT